MRDSHNGQSVPFGLTEWRSESLKAITTLMTNGFVGIATPFYVAKGGVPYFMANNVRANELDPKDHTLVSHEFHKRSARSRLRPGDILTVQTGHIGVSCLVPPEWDDSNAHALIISRCDPAKADSRFVCQYLNSWFGRRELWRIQTGGGRPHLNTTDMMHVRVLVPPPPVQRVVADVLDCYDQAAIRVRRLAVARRKLKRGLLQQLLTGQRRFPEFRKQPWVERRVSEVLQETFRPVTWNDDTEYRLASIRRSSKGLFDRGSLFGRQIKVKKLNTIRTNDFLISHIQAAYGAMGLVPKEFDGAKVSDMYTVLTPKAPGSIDMRLVNFLSQRKEFRHMAYLSSNGFFAERLRLNFDPRDFMHRKLLLPPTIEEQSKIADALETLDDEIGSLIALHDAMKEQKKGLMQKLLTGQVRVPASMLKEATHA